MEESLVKARKHKIMNVSFAISPVEMLPSELVGIADAVTVILPWGSLRDGIAKADPTVLHGLRLLGKPGTPLSVWIGYEEQREAAEMEQRDLPHLSEAYLSGLSDEYHHAGISLSSISLISNTELRVLESDWAKRLAFGAPRRIFRLCAVMM